MDKPWTDEEELNIAVAETVMGWQTKRVEEVKYRNSRYGSQRPTGRFRLWVTTPTGERFLCPDFVRDGKAFMYYVVTAMGQHGWTDLYFTKSLDGYRVTWERMHLAVSDVVSAEEYTRLRAACLAAVKAVESEERRG